MIWHIIVCLLSSLRLRIECVYCVRVCDQRCVWPLQSLPALWREKRSCALLSCNRPTKPVERR